MRQTVYGVLTGLLLATAQASYVMAAQNVLPASSRQFLKGEHLVFEVRWMGIPVGSAELWVKESKVWKGVPCLHFVGLAKTNKFLSKIYAVEDRVESLVDLDGFFSRRFERDVKEGKYRAHEVMVFEAERKKAHYQSLTNGSTKEIDLPGPVQDIQSAFYFYRLKPIQVGQSVTIDVNADEKNWKMKVNAIKRETLEIRKKGVFDTVLVEPKAEFRGVLMNRGRVWVNFTADERRLPVLITITTPYGRVVGILKEHSN